MPTLEEFKTTKEAEINAIKTVNGGDGLWKLTGDNEKVEFSDDDYNQYIIDQANWNFLQQEEGYKESRRIAYASIQDQLDMQYWDNVNGTTTWKDHIAQVKADNPKPS
jgi:hypothetical protein